MTTTKKLRPTLILTTTTTCAALYAIGISITSFIPTPWGVGNFRPGVLVPAFFAVVYGPFIGGLGAAIGCFIGDLTLSFFGLTNPLLSLLAGVPANFVGFYLMGWFTSKYPRWSAFVVGSFISLVIGNLIAAIGVVGFYSTLMPFWASWPLDVKIATVLGFTFFWVATMIPFVIPLMPPLIRAVGPILNSRGEILNAREITWGRPAAILKSTLIVSLSLLSLYAVVTFTPLGDLVFSETLYSETTLWVKTFILISSLIIIVFGSYMAALTKRENSP